MKRLRSNLTYANVMATIAVFLVLAGGTAFAASEMLPKNSVGSKQIKKGAVGPAKLSTAAKATITGATGATGAKGAAGPQGLKGDKGEKGEKGEKGANGVTDITKVESRVSIAKESSGETSVACPAGTVVTGGGSFDIGASSAWIYQSGPLLTGEGWEAFYKTNAVAIEAVAFALCATE